jgi:hypothetical protein
MRARADHLAMRKTSALGSEGMRRSAADAGASSPLGQPWVSLGPQQILTEAYGKVTGRVTSIAADPSDETGNTVFVGTAGGGVWKSVNAAASAGTVSFTPLTDDLPAFSSGALASMSIGALSVQPGGTGVVLAGTGDPNDAMDSYYGSGLLRSDDGGLTWSLITGSNDLAVNSFTNYYFVGEAFAGFAWSTATPNLVVAAVSQSAESLLVNAQLIESEAQASGSVLGLYYSTDAGQSWYLATIADGPGQEVQSSAVPPVYGGNAATAVVWNPVRGRFYAAVRFHGYYESADGKSWTRLANQPGAGLTATACPANPNRIGSAACPIFRGALTVQPATGDLFALTVDVNLLDQGLWRDVCGAASGSCASSTVTFSQQLNDTALEADDGSGTIPGGDYDLWLSAVPAASDTVLFAGVADIFRCSLLAGCKWRNATNVTTCAAAQVAPFQHAVDASFAASLGLMYFGNDGGLWRSTDEVAQGSQPCSGDDANHFQNLNGGLGSLAEVQGLAQDPADSAVVLAGVGLNGTAAETSAGLTVWPQVLDGYGSYVAIDPANPQNWYAQSGLGVAINLCTQGTACGPAEFGTPVIGATQVGFADAYASPLPSPFVLDPLDSTRLILGTCHVWRGPADGTGWSEANLLGELYPDEGPECSGDSLVQSLAAAGNGGGGETILAGMAGIGFDGPQAYSGHLFRGTVSGGPTLTVNWTDLRASPVSNYPGGLNPCDFAISSVTIDPHDTTGETIYATIQGFDTASCPTATVFASTNGGANWVNITSNLPAAPANSLAVDPNDANTVYVALDTGVYVTTTVTECAAQNCWSVYGTGLPNSPVVQLAVFPPAGQASGSESLLRAATYGRGIWQTPLVTAAATTTTATAVPASVAFGTQAVQTQSAPQTVTITNTGTSALLIEGATVSGDFVESSNCSGQLVAGGSCTVGLTFTPTATGERSGALTVYANVSGGQLSVPLMGTGTSGGAIVLLPTSLNFGSSLLGVATLAQNITISNTGNTIVKLQTPIVTGDFAIAANTCSASLSPQFGCTVSLVFTPTAAGPRTGLFSITDEAGTQTATLSGTGETPATDTVSPQSLSFAPQVVGSGSAVQAVTLTNSGDAALNSIQVMVAGDFQAVNGCGETLIAHASCAVNVSFVPTRVGAESGSLVINDMYGKPQTVGLTGTGVAPAGVSALPRSVDFGGYGVSASTPPQSVTITDNGGVPLNDLSFAISGDFAFTSSCGSSVAPGGACTVQVVFTPTQSGPRMGGLTISSSSLSAPFQIALSGNGLGFTFTVQGNSSETVTAGQTAGPYALQITPATGSVGTLTLNCSALPANSTCTVNPASVSLTANGTPSSIAVTIATAAGSSSASGARPLDRGMPGGRALIYALLLPACPLLAFRRVRRAALAWFALAVLVLVPLGCGVTASAGSSGTSTPPGGVGSTSTGTYNPIITASGPGISQSVQLTLVVE